MVEDDAMATFTLERTTTAPMETVFDVLTDHCGYADISAPRKVVLEREGDPAPNGVGAVRRIHLGPGLPPLREEVTLYDRPGRFAYKLLSGLPVRDHVGQVTLSHAGGGTHVSYRVETHPTLPGIGHAAVGGTRVAITLLLRDILKAAEQRSA
jgi:uncharacterized protein YndB with AHSA1/START domain